ncbi:MAG: glutathione S-transferase [Halocynthiibacter sp.]|jgi:glutathione S-transferase
MKLYHSPTSPYVRKVMVLLAETGQLGDVELVAAGGSPIAPGTMPVAQNPLGKIPALERADGPAIYDSRVICHYLSQRAGGKMYPKGEALWDALTLEATADGIVDAAILMVYEAKLRPADKQFDEWVEGQWNKVSRAIDALEGRWMAHLNGPLDIGQIAVVCALGYVEFRHGDRNWRGSHPELAAWYDKMMTRESFINTIPPA